MASGGPRLRSARAHHASRCTGLHEIVLVLVFQCLFDLRGLHRTESLSTALPRCQSSRSRMEVRSGVVLYRPNLGYSANKPRRLGKELTIPPRFRMGGVLNLKIERFILNLRSSGYIKSTNCGLLS